MNENDSKLIVFDKDINEKIGDITYVKFINSNSVVFYNPLIAPKYFDNYIKENNIEKAYVINDDNMLEKYSNYVYTFTPSKGIYSVNKGIEIMEKYVLLVDNGMEINLSLPMYSYVFKDNKFYVKKIDKKPGKKGYCYVGDKTSINEDLKKIMIPVYEAVKDVLSVNEYNFNCLIKTKKYEPKKENNYIKFKVIN